MEGSRFAEIVVLSPVKTPATDAQSFTYHLPDEPRDCLVTGSLVVVPFGSRRLYGVVVALGDEPPAFETRPVESLVAPEPVLTPTQLALARWMAQAYLAPLWRCLTLMLPPGVVGYADVQVALDEQARPEDARTVAQEQLFSVLDSHGPLQGAQLDRLLPREVWQRAAAQLSRRGVVVKSPFLAPPRARPKFVDKVEIVASDTDVSAFLLELSSNKQADVLERLLEHGESSAPVEKVCAETGCTDATLRILADRDWIEVRPAATIITASVSTDEIDQFLAKYSRKAPSQAAILDTLRDGPRTSDQFPEMSNALRSLEGKGLITRFHQPRAIALKLLPAEAQSQIISLRDIAPYPAIMDFLRAEGKPVEVSWVYAETGCTRQHLDKLAERGLVAFDVEEVWRDPLADETFVPDSPPSLTSDQQSVWECICSSLSNLQPPTSNLQPPIFLLHGVTGSGKTEIYLRAVAEVVAHGRQAIVLVPEISLTPQTAHRFGARFGPRIAILHSALTEGERYDTWRRIRAGLKDIVIGPRSALFAPFADVGLIVVDEEHDASYKQESPPYYHTRDAALELARITGAAVILGSATPSLESYLRAGRGEFTLLEMPRRIMGHARRLADLQSRYHLAGSGFRTLPDAPAEARYAPLPPVQIVDMRAELRAGNRSIFSRALKQALDEALNQDEQVILFLNRRGSATFVSCRDCGYVLHCPRCETPLTYHGPGAHLVCHHCNYREPQPDRCPQCGGERIRYFGLGTEKVEQAVHQLWPDARTLRWDRDTARNHAAHAAIFHLFSSGLAHVLVGTQMIAKGLDLPRVTVAGIVSADTALNLPDFRSGERTFQLLTQVAGRAGRGLLGGRVFIQTYHPDHYAVVAAAGHDYAGFAARELAFRREQGYPPYRRLAKLVYEDANPSRAQAEAEALAATLRDVLARRGLLATELIGPAPSFFAHPRGRYRWQMLLRYTDPAAFLRDVRISPGWRVDVDPVSVL